MQIGLILSKGRVYFFASSFFLLLAFFGNICIHRVYFVPFILVLSIHDPFAYQKIFWGAIVSFQISSPLDWTCSTMILIFSSIQNTHSEDPSFPELSKSPDAQQSYSSKQFTLQREELDSAEKDDNSSCCFLCAVH